MNKGTIVRIFGEAFLRATVIILGIAIIGFGGFFLVSVISDAGKGNNEATQDLSDEELKRLLEEQEATAEPDSTEAGEETTTAEVTGEPTTEEQIISSKDAKILVLNSTATKGLAKAWSDKLIGEGFATVEKGNYSTEQLTNTKIIVITEGRGKDLVSYFKSASLTTGSAPSGVDVSTDGYDIFIIIGTEDDIK